MKATTTLLRRIAALAAVPAISLALATAAAADSIAITEWMYKPGSGPAEYIELTNVTAAPIDIHGWSQDDSTNHPGVHPFGNVFGMIEPGESVILCEGLNADGFRTYWGLDSSVKVYAYGSQDNIGSSDAINVYDNTGALVDRLTYPNGGPSTSGISGNIPLDYLFLNQASHAVVSQVGDIYDSYRGGGGSGDLGNPGLYTPVPEPGTLALLAAGWIGLAGCARRKRR